MTPLVVIGLLTASLSGDQGDVVDVLDAWLQGCEAVTSYDLYVAAEESTFLDPGKDWSKLDSPFTRSSVARQVRSQGKRRIESGVSAPSQSAGMVHVWTGELSKLYMASAKQLMVNDRLNSTIPDGFVRLEYDLLYRSVYGNSTFDLIFRQRPTKSIESKEGSLFVLYTPPIKGDFEFAPYGFRVWLDAGRNFLPVRIQHLLDVSGEECVYVEFENELEEVKPNVWAVVRSVISGYPPIQKSATPPGKSYETTVQIDRKISTFNEEVPESTFELEIPVGVTVFDHVTGISYTYGRASGVASHLSELALQGKASVEELRRHSSKELRPDDVSTGDRPAVLPRRQTRFYWLVGTNLVLILLAGSLWYWRGGAQKSLNNESH